MIFHMKATTKEKVKNQSKRGRGEPISSLVEFDLVPTPLVSYRKSGGRYVSYSSIVVVNFWYTVVHGWIYKP